MDRQQASEKKNAFVTWVTTQAKDQLKDKLGKIEVSGGVACARNKEGHRVLWFGKCGAIGYALWSDPALAIMSGCGNNLRKKGML